MHDLMQSETKNSTIEAGHKLGQILRVTSAVYLLILVCVVTNFEGPYVSHCIPMYLT